MLIREIQLFPLSQNWTLQELLDVNLILNAVEKVLETFYTLVSDPAQAIPKVLKHLSTPPVTLFLKKCNHLGVKTIKSSQTNPALIFLQIQPIPAVWLTRIIWHHKGMGEQFMLLVQFWAFFSI